MVINSNLKMASFGKVLFFALWLGYVWVLPIVVRVRRVAGKREVVRYLSITLHNMQGARRFLVFLRSGLSRDDGSVPYGPV